MLTKLQALELISVALQDKGQPENPFVVLEQKTIEKDFGWVFFYNTKTFLETGIFRHRLAGNGPVIVNKHTGAVEFFGTNKPVEELIKEYEQKHR